jgi:hypothetical protein
MNHELAKKMWKEMGIVPHYFSLKGLEILHQERRGQVKTMEMLSAFSTTSPDVLTSSIPINQS